jgi:hypothetical protein
MMEVEVDDHDDATGRETTGATTATRWSVFQRKYPFLKEHVDFITKKLEELSIELEII